MALNITYAYTIEIGPLDTEIELIRYRRGFHVIESKIEYVVSRAFVGIHQYMRFFKRLIRLVLMLENNKFTI
jgi:hypothetical protein